MSTQNSPLKLIQAEPETFKNHFPNNSLVHLSNEFFHVYGALNAIYNLTLAAENKQIEAIHIATLLKPQKSRLWEAAKALDNITEINFNPLSR